MSASLFFMILPSSGIPASESVCDSVSIAAISPTSILPFCCIGNRRRFRLIDGTISDIAWTRAFTAACAPCRVWGAGQYC
ncbi:hypothetical protein BDW75DRAFT_226090 [Aspergillus navahoensis]